MPIVKHLREHRMLLDTHVWLGLVTGNPIFSQTFIKAADYAAEQERILVAPISIWEIGMLVEKKRIILNKEPLDWVNQALEDYGFRLTPFSPKIAIESTRIPDLVHADPADRILIATAHEENAILITCDEKILTYGQDRFVSCHDPRTHSLKF